MARPIVPDVTFARCQEEKVGQAPLYIHACTSSSGKPETTTTAKPGAG